jgi:hypothetical protein
MARITTSDFTQAITPGLRKYFFSSIKGLAQEYRQWANVMTGEPGGQAGKAFFADQRAASFGTFGAKPQGAPILYDAPVEESKVRFTPYTFALGFRITMEMKADDLYGVMQKLTGELGYAAQHQIEVQAHRPLNGAFATTGGSTGFNPAGYNAEALISTTHALVRGGTYANRATVDLDLSQTAIEAAQDSFEGTLNDSGMPTPKKGSVLVIPYQLKWIAKELLDSELKPYTGNNEVNVLGGENLTYICSHYLLDSDSWFLMAPKAQHEIMVWIRQAPSFDTGDDFDTKDTKASGVFRMASGHTDWRGVFGSLGA